MNTIVLQSPGDLRLTQTPEPDELPPGHALVRVHRVGICGTDWHAYHGRQPFFNYPRVIGHELGVEVERVAEAGAIAVGDRCAVEPYLNCGTCIACRRGKSNCCETLRVLGVHIDGGMREHIVVPMNKLHPSRRLSLEQLALVETLGIGRHAVVRAQIQRGEWVLIVGAGPIGLSVVPFVQADGGKVIVADVNAGRLAFCREQMKVPHTIDASGDIAAQLRRITGGDLPTAILDATGNAKSMAAQFDHIAHGGRIVFVGLFQGSVSFDDPNFHRREQTLLASRNALPADFKQVIALLENGTINTTPWITHRSPVQSLVQTLPSWLSPDAGVIKAMVEM